MASLAECSTLSWEMTKRLSDHVRRHGIKQFINQYNKHKDRKDVLYWGDEIECALVTFDHDKKVARLKLDSFRVLKALKEQERSSDQAGTWSNEYGAYMVESTPSKPYGGSFADLNSVEENMKMRRQYLQKYLGHDTIPMTLVNFPRTGCGVFTDPPAKPSPACGISRSEFCPDEIIYQEDPRMMAIARNIRERRGEKVAIHVPVYNDKKTSASLIEKCEMKSDHIYMDATGFGAGCACLQVTIQAADIDEAKRLYDQLIPLCPLMLALTAASPIYKGLLADIDNRWSVLAQSLDDRNQEELGIKPLKNDRFRIPKSRFGSVDSYLSAENQSYNDVDLVLDQELFNEMMSAGIDEPLSRHIAHLFIRDSLSLFPEKIDQNNEEETDHFENIQSTNWQTLRFKLPPPKSDIGWRVEFRPMIVQLSDFENAAFAVFVVLLTRVILTYNLNLVIPISKLALTAASPIYKGLLEDIDNRWSVLAQSLDDRTQEELGIKPLKHDRFRIPKSRFSSVDSYLSAENQSYNDVDLVLDQELCDEMTAAGIDEPLSRHIAHLFIRDSLSLFPEKIDQNNEEETDHFENIQSTNWQTLRFKLPPPKSDIGWRVEFRPMDVQLSDFENAALAVFVVLLTRVILTYNLNLVIPISKVEANMNTSYTRDAVLKGEFYFKKDIFTAKEERSVSENRVDDLATHGCNEDEYSLLSMNEIFNGNKDSPGLIPLVNKYIESIEGDIDSISTVSRYLAYMSKKASGEIKTTSRWIRDFVQGHPDYKQDSVVSDVINYDLLKLCAQYSAGTPPDLLHEPKNIHSVKNKDHSPKINGTK